MTDDYSDIINLPHHKSSVHPPMPVKARAAQFSPFAALSGYEEAVNETGRLTDSRKELDDSRKAELNDKLLYLQKNINLHPRTEITYFVPDTKKSGGAYITVKSSAEKFDPYFRKLILADRTEIDIDNIYNMEIK